MYKTLSRKIVFTFAIASAAVVGGTATAIVSAAIPSSIDGKVHTCYRNNASLVDAKGTLRVIDSDAGQSCTTQETALNISQNQSSTKTAFFRVRDGAVDTGVFRNIDSYEWYNGDGFSGAKGYCIKATFSPNVSVSPSGGVIVRNNGSNDAQSLSEVCPSQYDVFLQPSQGEQFGDMTLWLSE